MLEIIQVFFGVFKLFITILITLAPIMLKIKNIRKGLIAAALGIPSILLSVILSAFKFISKKLFLIK